MHDNYASNLVFSKVGEQVMVLTFPFSPRTQHMSCHMTPKAEEALLTFPTWVQYLPSTQTSPSPPTPLSAFLGKNTGVWVRFFPHAVFLMDALKAALLASALLCNSTSFMVENKTT